MIANCSEMQNGNNFRAKNWSLKQILSDDSSEVSDPKGCCPKSCPALNFCVCQIILRRSNGAPGANAPQLDCGLKQRCYFYSLLLSLA